MCAYIVLGTFLLLQAGYFLLAFPRPCEDDRASAVSCSVICAKPNLGAPMPQKLLGDSQRIIPQKFFSTDLIVSPSTKVITHPCSRRTHIFNYPPTVSFKYLLSLLPPLPALSATLFQNTTLSSCTLLLAPPELYYRRLPPIQPFCCSILSLLSSPLTPIISPSKCSPLRFRPY